MPSSQSQRQLLIVESVRAGVYLLILLVTVVSVFFQDQFTHWDLLKPFYVLLFLGLSGHALIILNLEKIFQTKQLLALTFVIDALLITGLIYWSQLNQSMFLFMYLVNIVICGLVFQTTGALSLAFISSVFFTTAAILGPEIKALAFLFLVALNDLAFFAIGWISGYLGEQINFLGTELETSEQNVRAIQNLNDLIVSQIPLALLFVDQNGVVIRSNPRAIEDLVRDDISSAEISEVNLFSIFPELAKTKVVTQFQRESEKIDLQYRKGEDVRILSALISPVSIPQIETRSYLVLWEDLTNVRQLEFSLRQSEKLAAVGGLAAGIAHEIRNPLASISGSIEMLSQTVTNEDDRRLMKIVLKEIDRLNLLITEFLEYARPEKPPTDPVAIPDILREILGSIELDAKLPRGVEQIVQFGEVPSILGHRDKLKQVFLNIILNAYQAMDSSETKRLTVVTEYIPPTENQVAMVAVRIEDTGCGMDESTRKKMFEPFHTTKPKGTGLGLAVTHKILEAHRAQIFVESEKSKFTKFLLQFPAVVTS